MRAPVQGPPRPNHQPRLGHLLPRRAVEPHRARAETATAGTATSHVETTGTAPARDNSAFTIEAALTAMNPKGPLRQPRRSDNGGAVGRGWTFPGGSSGRACLPVTTKRSVNPAHDHTPAYQDPQSALRHAVGMTTNGRHLELRHTVAKRPRHTAKRTGRRPLGQLLTAGRARSAP